MINYGVISLTWSPEPSVEYWGLEQLQPYLWASAGVLLCVVVVISLSVVSLQHCPGQSVCPPLLSCVDVRAQR